jgi:hypothetical protein
LLEGVWWVAKGSTLSFPEVVDTIDSKAFLALEGKVPSLQLRRLFGEMKISDSEYTATSGLTVGKNSPWGGGKLTLDGTYPAKLTVDGTLTNHGSITCEKGASITVNGDFFYGSNGRLHVDGIVTVTGTFFKNAPWTGDGTITAANTIGSGLFSPGRSPGTLTLNSPLTLTATAELLMEIAGTSAGMFDLLAVGGPAILGGTLIVPLLDNFTPAAGDTFAIVQAASIAGSFANVASGQRVLTSDGRGSFEVHYGAGSAFGANRVVLANWQPAGPGVPTITRAPVAQTVKAGAPLVLSVAASSTSPLSYQWRLRGANLPGATQASYTIPGAQGADQGGYSVMVTSPAGSVITSIATVTVDATTSPAARVSNLSTRALGLPGGDAFISGFVIEGTGSARMLLRTVGPALGAFGVTGFLPNPQMILQRLSGSNYVPQAANTDWGLNTNTSEIIATSQATGAFPLPAGGLDSALLVDLPSGQYSVVASDSASRGGIAIIELYDTAGTPEGPRLANISTRGHVGAGGDVLIPGFVISNEGARTLLIRAVGPTLGAFGVGDALADPQLTLYRRERDGTDTAIFANNDWGTSPAADSLGEVAASVGAFPLPAGSKDATLLATLQPGAYTAHVSGVGGLTGTALVEIYVVP